MAIPRATLAPLNRRVSYLLAATITVLAGLLVYRGWLPLPPIARDLAGDLLWATMMMWLVSAMFPSQARMARGVLALTLCYVVELSQLVRWEWLVVLRAHPLGHLVLGSDFDARDLFAYLMGVSVAVLLEALGPRRFTAP